MNKLVSLRTGVFTFGMLLAIGASKMLTPTPLYSPSSPPPIKLVQAVPTQFGGWHEQANQVTAIVSPEVKAMLEDLYSDSLARTYVNDQGDRIMLSLAYGADQSRALQVHKPEVCYEAQGFKIQSTIKATAPTALGPVPVMRVLTQKGPRNEPVTYWIRSGDFIVRGWFEQNLARVRAGLAGHYPDGILVRISSIDDSTPHAYAVQDAFVKDLVSALSPEGRKVLLGDKIAAMTPHSAP